MIKPLQQSLPSVTIDVIFKDFVHVQIFKGFHDPVLAAPSPNIVVNLCGTDNLIKVVHVVDVCNWDTSYVLARVAWFFVVNSAKLEPQGAANNVTDDTSALTAVLDEQRPVWHISSFFGTGSIDFDG